MKPATSHRLTKAHHLHRARLAVVAVVAALLTMAALHGLRTLLLVADAPPPTERSEPLAKPAPAAPAVLRPLRVQVLAPKPQPARLPKVAEILKPTPKPASSPTPRAKPVPPPTPRAKPVPPPTPRAKPVPPRKPQPVRNSVARTAARSVPPAQRHPRSVVRPPVPRVVRGSTSLARRGARLERAGHVPRVRLHAADEGAYFRFFEGLGARLFVECGGRIAREVETRPSLRFRRPRLEGLDRGHPRSLEGWSQGRAIVREARRQLGESGCSVVMLLPEGTHQRMQHILWGALDTALAKAGEHTIRDLSAVEGRYSLSSATTPAVRLERAQPKQGSAPVQLALEVRLTM